MEQGDLSSVLASLMSNPEMLSKVRDVASKLDFGTKKQERECDTVDNAPKPPEAVDCVCVNEHKCNSECDKNAKNRRRLIEALEPFLSKERCETAKRLLLITELIDSADCIKGR